MLADGITAQPRPLNPLLVNLRVICGLNMTAKFEISLLCGQTKPSASDSVFWTPHVSLHGMQ